MDPLLNNISTDPVNSVRAWYLDSVASIEDSDVRKERVRTLVDTFDQLDAKQRKQVRHWIQCFHMYYALRCSPSVLQIETFSDAALCILFSTRDSCKLLKKHNVYSMFSKSTIADTR